MEVLQAQEESIPSSRGRLLAAPVRSPVVTSKFILRVSSPNSVDLLGAFLGSEFRPISNLDAERAFTWIWRFCLGLHREIPMD